MIIIKYFTLSFFLVLSTVPALAAPEKIAVLSGTETTAVSSPNDLNQATPYALKWSSSNFDSNYFDHSTSSFSHQVKVKVSGDYRLSFTLPLTLNDAASTRRAILGEIYVNGSPIAAGRMTSSYIRQGSGHNESSLHTVVLLDGLNVNDNISIFVNQDATSGETESDGAQLYLEYIDSSRDIFSGTATQTTNSTNLNQSTAFSLEWTEVIEDASFTHSNSSNPEDIALSAGDYLVFVNIPLESSGCGGRIAVQGTVSLDGNPVTGGKMSQGYIRCTEGHEKSSLHWAGLVTGVTNGQVLTVETQAEGTNTTSTTVPASRAATIFIEKVSTSSDYISLSGSQLLAGNDWNPAVGSEVAWSTQSVIDSSTYTHSTSSNNHEITVDVDGSYFLIYNDHLTSTVNRASPKARVLINNSALASGSCKTHYIRNTNGHNESSCSLTHYLADLQAGDEVSVELIQEAASGQVDDASAAILTLIRVADADPPDCDGIVDCTPDLVLHVDGTDFTSILDESARNANDISFSGSTAEWRDISGSANDHDLTQTTASNQPTFDTVNKIMSFDGSNDGFAIANHADLNIATSLKERSIILAFSTGSDVSGSQVIYEEGGGARGMNVFIRAGNLHIGFWNDNDDGDGAQPFVSASTPVAANTIYFTSLVIDYSNYTGPSGPDGELRGHINGAAFPSIGTTTSLLYAHAGAIGLGFKNGGTHYDNGSSGGTGNYFGGEIFELLIYNHAIDDSEAVDFYNYLAAKWPDPHPVTNLALDSQYTSSSSTTPPFTWTASVSGDLTDNEVALGSTPGDNDVSDWASAGLVTSATISGLSLSECTNYYASVRAIDSDSNASPIATTDFLRFDGTDPSDPSGLSITGTSSTTTSKTLTWTASTDSCSFSHYEIAIGTSAGASDVVSFTDVGNVLSHQFTGISPSLATSTNYFTTIRAVDSAGNTSNEVSSSSWQVDTCVATDTTDPSDPGSFTAIGDAGPTTSPNHSWTASTDSCGLSHYEVAVGTSAGASDVVSFTDVGNVLSHKFFSISPSLATNTNYFTSIRAVDLAGNTSGVVSTSAWQLPTPGGVSSGLVLWLDASDTGTVFTDAGCSTPASDGSQIRCWQDKSTVSNNGSSSGSPRPTWETGEFNSQPVVRFDGTDDVIDFTEITDIRTVFIVNKSTASSFQPILGHSSTRHFYTANEVLIGPTISSADLRTGSWRVDGVDVSSPTTFTQTGAFSMISVVSTAAVEADHLASDQKTGGRFFQGDIAEVIIYDRALTSEEIEDVETYLTNKWFTANPAPVTSLAFDNQYTATSSQTPSFSWTHSSAPDLDHYEVALGTAPGSNDIAGWIDIGLNDSYQFLGLSLSECTSFYASVRAVDTDDFVSSIESTEFGRFDGTNPTAATSLVLTGIASETVSKTLSYSAASDGCSLSHYEIALGTSVGGNEVVDWTSVGNVLSHQFTSISPNLSFATNYYLSVRAVDSAGNTSTETSSSSWQLDTCIASDSTPPSDPSSLSVSGQATVTKSKSLSWTASTDSCAFSHYEASLGTSAGATDVINWTDIGNVTNHQFTDIASNLSFGSNYFLNVRAVDEAGNNSNTVSSSAWQLFQPGDVSISGLQVWLDANDSKTLYEDGSCSTGGLSHTDSVGCIKDKSGNDNHAVNSTGSNQPEYRTNSFSSKPSVYFDGATDRFLDFGTISTIRTVFWVLREDSSNPGNTAFLLGDPGGSTMDFHRDSTVGPIFSSANASSNVTSGTLQMNAVTIDGTSTNMPSTESVLSLVTTGNVTASAFSRDRTSCCGSRTWGGSLAELIIFNRALSGSEVTDVENYLMSKWGISAGSTEWTGATDTDWFTASNWSSGVPTANQDCVISNQTNNPVISSGTGSCRNFDLSSGTLTLQNSTGATLAVYGNLEITGTLNQNDGVIEFRDDGNIDTDQTLQSSQSLASLRFDKTTGGSVQLVDSGLTITDFVIDSGNDFTFTVPNGKTLTLPNGATLSSAVFNIAGGGTLEVGVGQTITVSGGTFKTSGTNDAFPQTTSNKALITRQGASGRWAFNSTSGKVDLTGFLIDHIDVNGLRIGGSTNLINFDGGQFTNLDTDFATPVKALQINTSASLTENMASNVGFNWGAANALYTGTPDPSDNYFTVYAPACNNSALIFDQWFGDFLDPSTKLPSTEDKIEDNEDGGNTCQISMTIAASPVNLLAFKATPYDQAVVLEWETGAEVDHLGFNVLRSEKMYTGYTQINGELIRNFNNSTTFRGDYRFTDENLENDKLYYYMIEDISIDGEVERHGPLSAKPNSLAGPVPDVDDGVNVSPSNPPGSDDLGEGVDLIHQTQATLRLDIRPSAITASDTAWDNSYRSLYIAGYSKNLEPGHPELLHRKILIEVDKSYTSVEVAEVLLTTSDQSAELNGKEVTPAPSWVLDNNQELEAQYAIDSAAYSTNALSPADFYRVSSEAVMIGDKPYVEVTVSPLKYNPVTQELIKLDRLVLDIGIDGEAWQSSPPPPELKVAPASIENNLRIKYDKAGMYELTYQDLYDNSVEGPLQGQSVNDLRLYYQGEELPLEVIDSGDGLFGSGDALRYYAPYETNIEDRFDEVVLTAHDLSDGNTPLRISQVDNQPSFSPISPPVSFNRQRVFEENWLPIFDVPLGGLVDRFYWKRVFAVGGGSPNGASRLDITADLNDLNPLSDQYVIIRVHLRGRGVFAQNPQHHIGLYLNSEPQMADSKVFTGLDPKVLEFKMAAARFVSGNNTIRLEVQGDLVNPGDYDLIDINKVEIDYDTYFTARNGVAHLTQTEAEQQVIVDGFSSSSVNVYDLSNSFETLRYQNFVVENLGGGNHSVFFDTIQGIEGRSGKNLVIIEDGSFLSASSFEVAKGSSNYLRDTANAADLLVIGPENLVDIAYPLIQLRKSQGLKVTAITLDAIESEFSHGRKSSYGIRDFIRYARTYWQLAPRYLLILGDATYDPNDYMEYGIPSQLMSVPIEKGLQTDFGSDNFYAEEENSHLPSLAIGRIPTLDQETLSRYINKVLDYESGQRSPADESAKLSVFISGQDESNEGFAGELGALSNSLKASNGSFKITQVHRSEEDSDADTQEKVIEQFNQGPLLMTYMGHGAENLWGSANMFDVNDVRDLKNQRLPIVMALNCLNSYYYDADLSATSLGEEMILNPDGGSIAFWGSTTMTAPIAQSNLATSMLTTLGQKVNSEYQEVRLGDLLLQAKVSLGNQEYTKDSVRSWVLFGDPTLLLPEKVFQAKVSSDVDVTPEPKPGPLNPQPNQGESLAPTAESSGGGGGCSVFAADENPSKHFWLDLMRELCFFLLVFGCWLALRLRRPQN